MGIQTDKSRYLAGRLLLATPSMGDPRFHRAVIYLCAHDENGAMGLVINHMLPGIDISELLQQLGIDIADSAIPESLPVFSGGPVETARGFILHGIDFKQDETIQINGNFGVTATLDALRDIAHGNGPQDFRFILGYAGWDARQLDQELQQNAWLVSDASQDLIFGTEPENLWDKAVESLGIDPNMLSIVAGRA